MNALLHEIWNARARSSAPDASPSKFRNCRPLTVMIAGQGAGVARVDPRDTGVGVGAPEHGGVEHAGKLHVVRVGGAPGEELRVLEARDVLADPAALYGRHVRLLVT